MSAQAPRPYDALPLPSKLRLDQACRDFEKAWRSGSARPGDGGQPPDLGPFLPEVPAAERLAFVQELVLLDVDYRRAGGYPCLSDDYLARFPELDRSWLLAAGADGPRAGDTTVGVAGAHAGESPVPADFTPPQRIGRYRVERVLGDGGLGLVYLAHDDQLQRLVAVKVPHRRLVCRPEDAEAYLTEARTVASLDHPHIVPVHDVGSTAQFPCYVVSKYIDGSTLARKIKDDRPSLAGANERGEYDNGMKVKANALSLSGYRLPTEAEWEYACRAGSVTDWSLGDAVDLLGKYAWHSANPNWSRPVGLLRPNELGLFDMHGNAWEWCHNRFADIPDIKDHQKDDIVVNASDRRFDRPLRGGNFTSVSLHMRSDFRTGITPAFDREIGVRPARTFR
jgi:hypothetical protein